MGRRHPVTSDRVGFQAKTMIGQGYNLDTSPIPVPSHPLGGAKTPQGGTYGVTEGGPLGGVLWNRRCIEDASPLYQGFGPKSNSV